MRYWIYDEVTKKVRGPFLLMNLRKDPGFGPEARVALEGARGPKDWVRAKDVEQLKPFLTVPAPPAPTVPGAAPVPPKKA